MKQIPAINRDVIEFPQAFPILISQTQGVSLPFQRLHWHSTLEINYIQQGSGYYLINGIRHNFKQGDIVLINSNELHRAFEIEGLVMSIIMFDPAYLALEQRYDAELLAPFREMGIQFDNVLDSEHRMLAHLGEIVVKMATEYERKESHFKVVVRAQLVQFLALVNRYFAKDTTNGAQHALGMDTIRKVLHEIEADISYPWTLRELAESAHLSVSRFSALFVRAVGTSPMNYLIQLRLSQAIELLESSNKKIIVIAEECGFRNLSNFNRLFKLHIGKLPSELNNRMK